MPAAVDEEVLEAAAGELAGHLRGYPDEVLEALATGLGFADSQPLRLLGHACGYATNPNADDWLAPLQLRVTLGLLVLDVHAEERERIAASDVPLWTAVARAVDACTARIGHLPPSRAASRSRELPEYLGRV